MSYYIKFHELAGSRRSSQKRKNVILSGVWNFHEVNKSTKIDDAAAGDIARLFFYDLAEPSGTNLNSRELSGTKWN